MPKSFLNLTQASPNKAFAMTDFERIEQAIVQQELEIQRLEAEIQERRQMIGRQREALSLLEPLLISVLGQPKVVTLEPDPVRYKGLGNIFQGGTVRHYGNP
jgi:hypothetical protein